MKNTIVFICCSFIVVGCYSVKESITEIEKEVPVLVTTPEMKKDSLDVNISDSVIVAVAKDSSVSVKIVFPAGGGVLPDTVAATFVRNKIKRILHELRKLPIRPQASVVVQPSTVRGKAIVIEKIIEREKKMGIFDYVKIGSVFFVIGLIVGLVLRR